MPEATMNHDEFRKEFAGLIDHDAEGVADAFAAQHAERKREIIARIRDVQRFEKAFKNLMSERNPNIIVDLIKHPRKPGVLLQVTAFADPADDVHAVDDAAKEAAEQTILSNAQFRLFGWGGGVNGWARDVTFWEA